MLKDGIKDGMSPWMNRITRGTDFSISLVCLIVFSPLFLICYLGIKWEDGGETIFKQERIGQGGKPFYIYKFRTMQAESEKDGLPQLCSNSQSDERLLRFGQFLRNHHLDELPQLWNVFVGDMAFVGPRPERAYFIQQIMKRDERYALLYQIKPGVTSYATLYNGYTDTIEKMLRRLELDLYYLQHRSFALNIKILFSTFWRIISGKIF